MTGKRRQDLRTLGAEDGDGVLGAEGDQAGGTPGEVVDDAVAAGADEDALDHRRRISGMGHRGELLRR